MIEVLHTYERAGELQVVLEEAQLFVNIGGATSIIVSFACHW